MISAGKVASGASASGWPSWCLFQVLGRVRLSRLARAGLPILKLKLGAAGLAFGWGMAEVAILVQTVAIYAYLASCFPTAQGEVSALVNSARTMGGVPMAEARGAHAPFAVEAGISAGLFLLLIPLLQWKGAALRYKFSIHHSSQ